MKRPKVCILRAAGTNCDSETAFAFIKAGAFSKFIHINSLIGRKNLLDDFQILVIPGGFTYADDIAAGKILANELKCKLLDDIKRFIQDKKLIIGICNGFQALVKSGLLPGNENLAQEASLIINDSGKFEDRWVYLKTQNAKRKTQNCIWTKNLPELIYLPVAHGEGKFVTKDKALLERLRKNNQIVFQYCDEDSSLKGYPYNPNGSQANIAGICDETGRIFGLMPHPERHITIFQHPKWTGSRRTINKVWGRQADGLQIFKNGVEYARKNL